MEYTKSEVREAKKRIEHELKKIDDWLPSVPNNWMGWVMITSSLEALKYVLNPLKTHIIDNDDFNLAIEINNMVSPVWDDYFGRVNRKELGAHSATWEVYDIIKDLRDWIGEYEAKHPKQPDTPTASPSAKEDDESMTQKGIIDKESLKTLFVDLFFIDDYDIQDTHNKSIKLSRYDKFCQRLEMVLTDTDNKPTQKNIGEIAYMIYSSPFTRAEYHKPKRTGEKGHFSNLINTFFDIVGKGRPSDTRPNKYEPKDEDGMKLYFGDILKWE